MLPRVHEETQRLGSLWSISLALALLVGAGGSILGYLLRVDTVLTHAPEETQRFPAFGPTRKPSMVVLYVIKFESIRYSYKRIKQSTSRPTGCTFL